MLFSIVAARLLAPEYWVLAEIQVAPVQARAEMEQQTPVLAVVAGQEKQIQEIPVLLLELGLVVLPAVVMVDAPGVLLAPVLAEARQALVSCALVVVVVVVHDQAEAEALARAAGLAEVVDLLEILEAPETPVLLQTTQHKIVFP